MARYSYMIPRDTKGEGKILMIFSKKSLLWTIACGFVGVVTIYPICIVLGFKLIGLVGILLFGLIGFIIGTCKIPESQNFEIFRKTGGENIDEIMKAKEIVEKALSTLKPLDANIYTVVAGDTLWGISRRYGLSVEALCTANNIKENQILRIGTRLVLPIVKE